MRNRLPIEIVAITVVSLLAICCTQKANTEAMPDAARGKRIEHLFADFSTLPGRAEDKAEFMKRYAVMDEATLRMNEAGVSAFKKFTATQKLNDRQKLMLADMMFMSNEDGVPNEPDLSNVNLKAYLQALDEERGLAGLEKRNGEWILKGQTSR